MTTLAPVVPARPAPRPAEPGLDRAFQFARQEADVAWEWPLAQEEATPPETEAPAPAPQTPGPEPGPGPLPGPTEVVEPGPGVHGPEAPPGLIVEDDAPRAGPHQMGKTAFLAVLRPEVCAVADAELARAGRTSEGCPYLESAFARYAEGSAEHLERALRRYAPEARGAASARDYLPPVLERVRAGVAGWAATGELSGVPEEMAGDLPGAGGTGILGTLARRVSGLVSGLRGILAKTSHPGDPSPRADPATVRARLGAGRPLDPAVRAAAERALGHDFSAVRVHTGPVAHGLAAELGARAFTVGTDVAFAPGEYAPGTLPGDAVLAHELAHVVQQGAVPSSRPVPAVPPARGASLEEEADLAAVGAVVATHDSGGRLARLARTAMPRLRSGLGLQRCAAGQREVRTPESGGCTKEQRESVDLPVPSCCTPGMLGEIDAARTSAGGRVRTALGRLSNPESARDLLRTHFNLAPEDTARVSYVRTHFEKMLGAVTTDGAVKFYCRDAGDYPCQHFHRRAAADNCSSVRPPSMWFCGDYNGSRFFSTGDWIRSVVHEYAHAACDTPGGMLAEGQESYRNVPGRPYPPVDPDGAIRNADSYASFASE